ncbi:OmpA family protein [Pusillimonas sp. SM2304]|uniref:OmpA family protein n=1 Tax=Pusillimonas sp. SM2304 TaxID=3073241 RepID=UPI002874C053|nr:OmpA family protein [Pusillimonas sp. SM2304]MDS1138993.1 OmpA family protein [Pusillimonas sp. SM2304]
MSVVHQNKWYVEPVPEEETEGWLLTYLDLITLLLVLLVVMLALSGTVAKLSPAATTAGLLPAHSGLLPGGSAPDVLQAVPQAEVPVPAPPATVPLIPAPPETDPLPAITAHTEWDPPTYAPGLAEPDLEQATFAVELPSYFQGETDPDAVLQHVMGDEERAPVSAAPEPAAGGVGLLALPELGDDIEIIRKQESVSFRINSEILYTSAKADLSREGLAVLRKLLPVLKDSQYTITVEGHTDALPIRGGQYPSNWELSGARAGRVVRYLAANGVGRTRLRAIGYADTQPLASNDTEQGRASNRRVEIILEQPAPPGPPATD